MHDKISWVIVAERPLTSLCVCVRAPEMPLFNLAAEYPDDVSIFLSLVSRQPTLSVCARLDEIKRSGEKKRGLLEYTRAPSHFVPPLPLHTMLLLLPNGRSFSHPIAFCRQTLSSNFLRWEISKEMGGEELGGER